MSSDLPPDEDDYLKKLHALTLGGDQSAPLSPESRALAQQIETLTKAIASTDDPVMLGKIEYQINNLAEKWDGHEKIHPQLIAQLHGLLNQVVDKKSSLAKPKAAVSGSGEKKQEKATLDIGFMGGASSSVKPNFTINKDKTVAKGKWTVDLGKKEEKLSSDEFVGNMHSNFELPVSKEASSQARETSKFAGTVPLQEQTIDLLAAERQKGSKTLTGGIGDSEKTRIAREGWAEADKLVRKLATSSDVVNMSPKDLEKLLGEVNKLLTPGSSKSGQIRDEDRGGELLPASLIAQELPAYCEWLMHNVRQMVLEPGTVNPIELAAQAYQRLNSIHAFGDGNGRVCQMMMDFVLQAGKLLPATLNGALIDPIPPEKTPSEGTIKMTTKALETVTQGVKNSYALIDHVQLTPPSNLPELPPDERDEDPVTQWHRGLHAAIQSTGGDREKLIRLLGALTPSQREELREGFQTDIDLVLGYPGRVDEAIQRKAIEVIAEFQAIERDRNSISPSRGGGGWGEPDPDSSSDWGRNHPLGHVPRDVI